MEQLQPQVMENNKILTGEFVGSFISVFQKKQYEDNEPQYEMDCLFDPNDPTIQLLASTVQQAALANPKWGGQIPADFKSPIKSGNIKDAAKYPEYQGKIFIKVTSKNKKPLVIDRNKAEILDQDSVYAGAFYRAILSPWCYDNKGNRGASLNLDILQKLNDGQPYGAPPASADIMPDLMPQQNQMPQGQMPQGQMPQGQMPQGQMPQGQMPQGQMPQGQMPQGQMPQGQMPQGQAGGQAFNPQAGGQVDLSKY